MYSKIVDEIEAQTEVKQHELLLRWTQITVTERQSILKAYIQEQVASFVGINPSEIDLQQSLKYLGIDSLIAVKLRNKLRTDLGVDVPAVKFLEDSTVASLATLVSEKIENNTTSASLAQVPIPSLNQLSLEHIEIVKGTQHKNREHLKQEQYQESDWLEGEI
ncbi:MAG: acyl carrier protein [Scytonematopsis contorta HA4267-MV1]|jgi:acyl carrier protein|nr:acyl carrier protein [Scytonematopsis contorta HA4267-MV1]